MINSIDFYFEVSKEAKIATDGEGGYSKCYLKFGFELKEPIDKNESDDIRNQMANNALIGAANFLKVDKSLLKMISEEEYTSNTDDDSDDGEDDCFAEDDEE